MNHNRYIAVIPARYASTRFPAKPLARLAGKTIIERVYKRVVPYFDTTIVATDNEEILATVQAFGGQAVMTSTHHRSGTDRCAEALEKVGGDYDVVVNVQGDEPFIHPSQLKDIRHCFEDSEGVRTDIATLVVPFPADADYEILANPNSPKVVVDARGYALYFSRSVVPYLRGIDYEKWTSQHTYYKHIGLYAYRTSVLKQITQLPPSLLEKAESLEQLRWLENGYRIRTVVTAQETIGIDTPEDLERAERFLETNPM